MPPPSDDPSDAVPLIDTAPLIGTGVVRPRWKLGIGAAIVLALVVLSVVVGVGLWRGQVGGVEDIPLGGASATPSPRATGSAGEVYVHVLGEVARPGLYGLDDGARVAEALAAAGGSTATADLRSVNLARVIADGEQIVVAAAGAGPAPPSGSAVSSAVGGGSEGAPVDLNTADSAALESLPRIGPALAARIIEWREKNGRFTAVDDLLAVPGIGEKLLAGIRDRVRV
ncbi:competence protein ComEA [Microbacterium resistens]|uniref:Competence protein ComEA n=1 Tax=Microbacterium resistens TaxID=156977 RepID=A0ABU1SGR4_9MICO|nr:ComEA family DNA-binding protein [Microbacterium resistens]MDR6868795.1 competence protein ComEA [Microbacterium resistens]